ncbi:hypothetical protein ACQ4PT_009822 [Festuca glaucescens]
MAAEKQRITDINAELLAEAADREAQWIALNEESHRARVALKARRHREAPPTPAAVTHRQMAEGKAEQRTVAHRRSAYTSNHAVYPEPKRRAWASSSPLTRSNPTRAQHRLTLRSSSILAHVLPPITPHPKISPVATMNGSAAAAPPVTPHPRISPVTTMDDSAAAAPPSTRHPGISSDTTMDDCAAAAADAATDEEAPKADPQTLARWYQLEALERAVTGNTVTFLETGAGKTLIAVLLLRSYAHRIRLPAREFAVFLVPTVVLVEQ